MDIAESVEFKAEYECQEGVHDNSMWVYVVEWIESYLVRGKFESKDLLSEGGHDDHFHRVIREYHDKGRVVAAQQYRRHKSYCIHSIVVRKNFLMEHCDQFINDTAQGIAEFRHLYLTSDIDVVTIREDFSATFRNSVM